MHIFISIKPDYASHIRSDTKKIKYRKNLSRNQYIISFFISKAKSIKRIIWPSNSARYIINAPNKLWKQTKLHTGVDELYFFTSFSKKSNIMLLVGTLHLLRTEINPLALAKKLILS